MSPNLSTICSEGPSNEMVDKLQIPFKPIDVSVLKSLYLYIYIYVYIYIVIMVPTCTERRELVKWLVSLATNYHVGASCGRGRKPMAAHKAPSQVRLKRTICLTGKHFGTFTLQPIGAN